MQQMFWQAGWWKNVLQPQLLPGSGADTASAKTAPAAADRVGQAAAAAAEEVVCPNGNPACLDQSCRNPNCGVGKRGNKKAQQAAKAKAAQGEAKQGAGAAMDGPLRMRSAQRYPLSYPRRYYRAGNQTEEAGHCARVDASDTAGLDEGGEKDGLRICEFHNYDPQGCRKGSAGQCSLSHECCHFCGVVGHRALECEEQLAADAKVLAAMVPT